MDREYFEDKLYKWGNKLSSGDKELHFACVKFLYVFEYEQNKFILENDDLTKIFDKIGYPSMSNLKEYENETAKQETSL